MKCKRGDRKTEMDNADSYFSTQLPELGKYIQEGGDWSVVLSQNLGMLTGTSIMLVIALYEHYAN